MSLNNIKNIAPTKCKNCSTLFTRKNDHGRLPVFCSRACSVSFKAAKEDTCQKCGKLYKNYQKHKNRKHCSFACRNKYKPKIEHTECPVCLSVFLPTCQTTNKTGLQTYCSEKCANTSKETREEIECLNCKRPFYPRRDENKYCSSGCHRFFETKELSPNWKGGRHITKNGFVMINIGPCRYRLEHRVIVEAIIGRKLQGNMPVLHLNERITDNRPENLYICEGFKEFRDIKARKIPFPKKSNLNVHADRKTGTQP